MTFRQVSKIILFLLIFIIGITKTGTAQGGTHFSVRDFGAKGDSVTLDTDAINKAIKTASASGGGTVYFPAGTYSSYSIHMQSHISIYLDQGAILLAAEPKGKIGYDAPEPFLHDAFQDYGHSHWHNSLIWGEDLVDISIIGSGTILGKGLSREGPHASPIGNKAIAFKSCRNVTLRDFTVLNGGHFAILATGVDNLTIDNLKIDTNRDGMDIDCCKNVHISNCHVNSPWDDAICLKSSFALGYVRATENVTIINCQVSGYDRGTYHDGTYQRKQANLVPDKQGPTGRIKFGTESNGGFKNIAISNCVFEFCRGLALETVDGGLLEDITITNITMRDIVNSPIFLRLGGRLRGPAGTSVGALRRINISNINVYNADSHFATLITGLPDHYIEDIRLSNISIWYRPLDSAQHMVQTVVPEHERSYPEPQKFGVLPAYGLYLRHVKNIDMQSIRICYLDKETRPAMVFIDVKEAMMQNVSACKTLNAPTLVTQDVNNLRIQNSNFYKDTHISQKGYKSF